IGEDGSVTAYTGKVELGQNIRTSLTQAIAEELAVPLESVHLVMADTALTPFDMGTFGSQTTPRMSPQIRRAAASAREWLVSLAAEKWQVAPDTLTVQHGKVLQRDSNKSVGFEELVKGQKLTRTISESTPVVPREKWSVLGTSVPKVNGEAYITGRHR